MEIGEDGLKAANPKSGMDVAKKETFEKLMLEKVNNPELMARINNANLTMGEREAGLIELLAYAEAQQAGASRFMLSYLANDAYKNLNQKYYAEKGVEGWEYKFTDKGVPPSVQEQNKREVIN